MLTIDSAQQFIIIKVRDGILKGNIANNKLAWANYDIYIETCVKQYMSENKIPTHADPTSIYDQIKRETLIQQENSYNILFSDAAWDLCRKNILRPGINYSSTLYAPAHTANQGFAITTFGREWLLNYRNDELLPADPNRFSQIFSKFQLQYGQKYFRRAREAVSCLQVGNFLACCVMCGAAAEAILLSAAFLKENKDLVIKQYMSSRGRSNIEKLVFNSTESHIKNRYTKYTDLINYWRDESGHGHESDINIDEAYIALLTLLRFAEFMNDNWEAITVNHIKTKTNEEASN